MFEIGLLLVYIVALFAWAYTLRRKLGWQKAIAVTGLRLLWTLPLVLGVFPQQEIHQQFNAKRSTAVYALVDDSISSRKNQAQWRQNLATIKEQVNQLCEGACQLKVLSYSDLAGEEVSKGYTPTEKVIRAFLDQTKGAPFVWFTDGGHQNPDLSPKALASRFGIMANQGYIITGKQEQVPNLRLVPDTFPTVSFSEKPILFKVGVTRSTAKPTHQPIQLHVQLNDQNLETINGGFVGGEKRTEVAIKLKPLPKGRHFLKVKLLAAKNETTTWDNEIIVPVEVVSDTIGVLHILGSPSWGGRFMRQFFKSEPKYDLISFYILRDPSDHYSGDDRSLSLIPFPVERLFTKELPNFKFVVIHNFTLHKFLEPQYVNNLVKYVENGGGLLFVGGERALVKGDFTSSPLQKLLPFSLNKPVAPTRNSLLLPMAEGGRWQGPYYAAKEQFWLHLDDPREFDASESFPLRTLIRSKFRTIDLSQPFEGLHKLSEVKFAKEGVKPILYARDSQNAIHPLLVASFPKKGRALWLFTDNLWRLGFEEERYKSYGLYRHLFSEATSWLTHKSHRSSMRISSSKLRRDGNDQWAFELQLSGDEAFAAYESESFRLSVCGINPTGMLMERISSAEISLSGSMKAKLKSGGFCEIVARYQSPNHGLIEARTTSKIPVRLSDTQLIADYDFLTELAKHADLAISSSADFAGRSFREWLQDRYQSAPASASREEFVVTNPFWRLAEKAWLWLLLALPSEIIVRKRFEFT